LLLLTRSRIAAGDDGVEKLRSRVVASLSCVELHNERVNVCYLLTRQILLPLAQRGARMPQGTPIAVTNAWRA
jgi:hypothetical protein